MASAQIVLTSVESREDGSKIARELVERRLAACVNIIGPIRSIYRWKGKVEDASEHLLLIKTTAEGAEKLASAFQELHPYELPERIALELSTGSEDYLAWLVSEVGQ